MDTNKTQTGKFYRLTRCYGDSDTCAVLGVAANGREYRGAEADAVIAAERAAGRDPLLLVRVGRKEMDLAASLLRHEVFRAPARW